MTLTKEQLLKITNNKIKSDKIDLYLPHLNKYMTQYGIDTNLRVCAFLAQILHESGLFNNKVENLNYSADGLINTFKHDFDTNKDKVISIEEKKKAESLARKPEQIANFVYANQNGNGSESTGDGNKYKGRGLIQITGKYNYDLLSKDFGVDLLLKPELLESPEYAVRSACWFWKKNKLNISADKGDLKANTKTINGGLNNYDERLWFYNSAISVIK
jgi:putative chitinase